MPELETDRMTLKVPAEGRRLEEFADEVRAGLGTDPKSLPCRFLYDEEGSRIFDEICEVPEYYPTRTERAILADNAREIAAAFPDHTTLVELGSGSADKTRILIEAFLEKQGSLTFVPVDISPSALEQSSRDLLAQYPNLEIQGFAYEYEDGLRRIEDEIEGPKLILWLGSNIGNLTREDAREFLGRMAALLGPDDALLVGIDLHKDPAVIEAAYNDAGGVSARFNLNLLARINRELGGGFDLADFEHEAVYHPRAGRVEMNLVSRRDQRVPIEALAMEVGFRAGEKVHTEYSYKYRQEEIEALAAAAGLRLARQWFDAERKFSENLLLPA